MKTLRKLLVLAPVLVMSLTACEAKIDEAKAAERAKAYNVAEVSTQYKSLDQKSECKVNKNTGVFADGGMLGSVVTLLKTALNNEEKGIDPAEGIYTAAAFAELASGASIEGAKTSISYYAYKSTGLKIVGEAKADQNSSGMKMTGSSKATMYVLDDGRIEKGSGSVKMNVTGEAAGVKLEGALDLSFTVTYTWNKA